ncbi:Transposon Ty3-I Gag-Pol polyprotein [Rhizoctonia solani]|uniref:Transposon Ty3-I Gag-Pol polyprotein n=1 Tax=Rhizoctonia solani TaxID=456999 RepID=A0A8H8NYQ5_9AGAM|nr:Transposon Ty3-I Gag-Pol polyprotein [Rhizoctonia solani]QRW22399.1 Transposon Ty3-I Gag-Pol polyprotein [Rhizoctonia solani]
MSEKLSQFNCTIKYIEGSKNVLADALLRMYSEDKKGTEHAESKFVPDYKEEGIIRDARTRNPSVTQPVVTGMAAKVASKSQTTLAGVQRNPERKRVALVCYNPEIPGRAGQRTRAPRNQGNERVKENWNPNIRDEFVGEQILEEDPRETKPNKREETSPASIELEGGSWADNKQDKWDLLDRSDH